MLNKENLLTQNALPHIKDISLKLYKDFSVSYLLNKAFCYYFDDGTEITIKFREWGIYHMLAIQHIDGKIGKTYFFDAIDNGLKLSDFIKNKSIKNRYKLYKERITSFACMYFMLENGKIFYYKDRKVSNTKSVEADFIIYNVIDGKGINVGVKRVGKYYVPITILIAKSNWPEKYIEGAENKLLKRIEIVA